MTNEKINTILRSASKINFTSAIEHLQSYDAEYRKSSIYKTTKIPLLQLYREYLLWQQANRDIVGDFGELIKTIDKEAITNELVDLVKYILENKELGSLITNLLDTLDIQSMSEYAEELKKGLSNLQNK